MIDGMDVHLLRREALKELIERFSTQSELSRAANLDPSHLSQMKVGRREIGEQVARKIEQALQLDHGWMDLPRGNVRRVSVENKDSFIVIPKYTTEYADLPDPGPASVPIEWLASKNLSVNDVVSVVVTDDGHAGRLKEGDVVVVSKKWGSKFKHGSVYAILVGNAVIFRMASTLSSGSVVLSCANPSYPSETLSPEDIEAITVIGIAMRVSADL